MKTFRIDQFFINANNFLNIPYYMDPYNRGFKNITDIEYLKGTQAVVKTDKLYIKIKKIGKMTQFIGSNEGVFVTLISEFNQRDWGISLFEKIYETNDYVTTCILAGGAWNFRPLIKNFYIIIMTGILGYISNIGHYYSRNIVKDLFVLLRTNYKTRRKPSMVFITKHSLKQYYSFYSIYLKMKSIILKTKYIYDIDRNVGFDIYVPKCFLLYRVLMGFYDLPVISLYRDYVLNYKYIMNKYANKKKYKLKEERKKRETHNKFYKQWWYDLDKEYDYLEGNKENFIKRINYQRLKMNVIKKEGTGSFKQKKERKKEIDYFNKYDERIKINVSQEEIKKYFISPQQKNQDIIKNDKTL